MHVNELWSKNYNDYVMKKSNLNTIQREIIRYQTSHKTVDQKQLDFEEYFNSWDQKHNSIQFKTY